MIPLADLDAVDKHEPSRNIRHVTLDLGRRMNPLQLGREKRLEMAKSGFEVELRHLLPIAVSSEVSAAAASAGAGTLPRQRHA